MLRVKQASKRKAQTKAVTVLGVAGALSLAGGAPGTVGPAGDAQVQNTPPPVISLDEEEISDVSLSTFYVFTTKTLEHVVPAYNSLRGRVVGRGKVAEAAQQTAEAEAPHAAQPAQAPEGRVVVR